MIATHPAVQHNCKWIHIVYRATSKAKDKRIANRRHRRYLNAVTKGFETDVDLFDAECFDAPSFSNWDID
jgi:hypothetical protein